MITPFQIYLISIADNLCYTVSWIIIILSIAFVAVMCVFFYRKIEFDEEIFMDKDDIQKSNKISFSLFKKICIILSIFLFLLIHTILPTTKTLIIDRSLYHPTNC
jgi:uncharacterized BrkB/YihY/UPF0761 family membrane protein